MRLEPDEAKTQELYVLKTIAVYRAISLWDYSVISKIPTAGWIYQLWMHKENCWFKEALSNGSDRVTGVMIHNRISNY